MTAQAPAPVSPDEFEETVISSRGRRVELFQPQSETPACLVVISHPDSTMLGRSYEIAADRPLTIGRSAEVEIALPGIPAISRRHARILRRGAEVIIEDLGSRNGTFLRGDMLSGPAVLQHGDQITVESVHIRYISGSNIEQAYHEAIYELVMLDDLTQIYNRRKYENELERDFARARRHHRALTLVLFDIDQFKEINDQHGHLSGDAVLQQIAALVTKYLRKEEIFARCGGDEFVVICPEVGVAGGTILAERLRAAIAQHEFRRGELALNVTCSFGVAELTAEITSPEGLYAAADARLYAAKLAGKNAVG